jgi:hypothetical protein
MNLRTFKDRKFNGLWPPGGRFWLVGLFAILLVAGLISQRSDSQQGPARPAGQAFSAEQAIVLPKQASAETDLASSSRAGAEVSPNQKELIERLFRQVRDSSDSDREGHLKELRRVLQSTFRGQEDCWSCEGTLYFDRFDELAGRGEGRKPMGLLDWISEGDEAYESRDLEAARQFYGEAQAIIDERVFQPEDEVDGDALDRLRRRCQELNCR